MTTSKNRNFCANHMNKFNRPAVHKDRKQAMKDGETKHKEVLDIDDDLPDTEDIPEDSH